MFCKHSGLAVALLAVVVVSGTSCRQASSGPPPRYAILRFENLTGDPALDWAGRAAAEVLSRSLAGAPGHPVLDGPVLDSSALSRISSALGLRPTIAPGISAEHTAALAAGATRIVSGYFERVNGRIRMAAVEEDPATGKINRDLSASGQTPFEAIIALARVFSPQAGPYVTSRPEAVRLYATALDKGGSPDSGVALEQALQTDPDFGPAWIALIGADAARGDRAAASDAAARARQHKLDPLDQANLDLAQATLAGDAGARITALRRVSALSPGDPGLVRSVAEIEVMAGQFQNAASDWTRLTVLLPKDTAAWNQLGYTRAWAGDYPGAIKAFEEYARLLPNDPNPLDSLGDANYIFGKFSEAAARYLDASKKDPRFLDGGELYKGAWAKFRSGDKAGADALFSQFREVREKANTPNTPLVVASWLYRTGRRDEAKALLRKNPQPADFAQLAVWELLDGERAAAAKDAAALGRPTSAGFATIQFAAQPSASVSEWEARAAHLGPMHDVALAYALLFDGRKEAAAPLFDRLARQAPSTDFFLRAIDAKLKGDRPPREIVPDPANINEFAALLDRL